ncbi:MAG: toprim domain-containing protein, partial [Bacteroidota bacterium]
MITNAEHIRQSVTMVMVCEALGKEVNAKRRCGCPVHDGEDKNFQISKSGYSGTCYSQCGGKNWNTVELLQEIRGYTYPEALEELAKIGRITVERTQKLNPEEIARYKKAEEHKASLADNLKLAYKLYPRPKGKQVALPDGKGRSLSAETIKAFDIVISPPEQLVLKAAQVGTVDEDILLELGVLAKSKVGKLYDPFSNRIIFPIYDHLNKLVGITGRVTETNKVKAKYWNTDESPLFQKRKVLFGLKQNWKNIQEFGAVLVESNMSVVTMYDQNLRRAVASMGTAVTKDQLLLLKRYTDQLTIMMDADKAGKEATTKAATLAIELGFNVKIVNLPEDQDPDDFLRADKKNAANLKKRIDKPLDAIITLIDTHLKHWDEDEGFQRIAKLFATITNDLKKIRFEEYLEEKVDKKVFKMIKTRAGLIEKERAEEAAKPRYSDEEAAQIEKFQIYERNDRVYACSRLEDHGIPITNFTVRPVMQVIGSAESRVLLELKNIKGMRAKMEVNTDAMTEIGPFKKEILRRGFYVFDESAKPYHYNRMLSWLFDDMKHCHPLTVLGWNESQKFYAWANGLSLTDGTFKKIDEDGIVEHGEHRFFLPAFSSVHTSNPGDDTGNGYENMRGFVLDTNLGCPTMKEWAELFVKVHGDNGKVGIAFYLSCIFRSYIFEQFRCFPLLNLFGPPGLGKSFMAQSIAAMWGESRSPFNLHDGTDVGLFRRMAQMKDGVVFLDEFNNQILPKRFQACKNFYDGAGREKGQKTQDNRTTTTPVTSGVMLVGQQQPTQDPAMFSRVVSLNFGPRQFSEEEKENARQLKAKEGTTCLSQITAKLLTYRDYVKQNYLRVYDEVSRDINQGIPNDVPRNVVSRLTKNNAMLLATFKLLSEKEDFGFTYKDLRDIMHRVMVKQLFSIGQEDDQATWWEMIQYALRKGHLQHGRDLLVEAKMKVEKVEVVTELGKT